MLGSPLVRCLPFGPGHPLHQEYFDITSMHSNEGNLEGNIKRFVTCSLDAPLYLEGTLKKVVTCFLDAPLYLEGNQKKVVTCFLDAPLYLEGTLKKAVTCFLDAPVFNLNVPCCNCRVH